MNRLAVLVLGVGIIGACTTEAPTATRGTKQKGEPCTTTNDCADASAICRAGNVCTGPLDGDAFMTECTSAAEAAESAPGGPETCAGLVCLTLKSNEQDKQGICTLTCADDVGCGPSGACHPNGPDGRGYCLAKCSSDADCHNGFVCVSDDDGRTACLVRKPSDANP